MSFALSAFIAFALAGTANGIGRFHERGYYEQKFYDWLQLHKVEILNGSHFVHFLENFANNDDYIEQVNSRNLTYQLGHNHFSHLDVYEWRDYVQLGLAQPKHSGTKLVHDAPADPTSLPASVDWREKGAVTAVKDQGQCGSCWSFSTTGALEGANQLKTGKLVSLSEQHFFDCDDNGDHGCFGGLMDNAFEWAQKNGGVCGEDSYPYNAKKGRCQNKSCGDHYAAPKAFTDVKENNVQAMLSALAQQPVSVAIEADQQDFQLYKSGVFSAPCGTNLDHGVLAVGYGTDDGQDYWIVKNSWGTKWGEDGYIRLARNVDQKEGQCGILSGPPSYPNL